jgi:hypothetical protein
MIPRQPDCVECLSSIYKKFPVETFGAPLSGNRTNHIAPANSSRVETVDALQEPLGSAARNTSENTSEVSRRLGNASVDAYMTAEDRGLVRPRHWMVMQILYDLIGTPLSPGVHMEYGSTFACQHVNMSTGHHATSTQLLAKGGV